MQTSTCLLPFRKPQNWIETNLNKSEIVWYKSTSWTCVELRHFKKKRFVSQTKQSKCNGQTFDKYEALQYSLTEVWKHSSSHVEWCFIGKLRITIIWISNLNHNKLLQIFACKYSKLSDLIVFLVADAGEGTATSWAAPPLWCSPARNVQGRRPHPPPVPIYIGRLSPLSLPLSAGCPPATPSHTCTLAATAWQST